MRKPVWATMRWSGRTAWPSMCQPRCSTSSVRASIQLPLERLAGLRRLRDRRRVGDEDPARPQHALGVRAPPATARAGRARPGRTPPSARRRSPRSCRAARRRSARGRPRRGTRARCSGPGWRSPRGSRTRRSSAPAAQHRHRQRPRPDPASRTPACPGRCRRACRSAPGPSDRSPARRVASRPRSPRASGAARCTRRPCVERTTIPSARPTMSACAARTRRGCGTRRLLERDEVAPALRVEQQHPLADPQCAHRRPRRRDHEHLDRHRLVRRGHLDQAAERAHLARSVGAPHARARPQPLGGGPRPAGQQRRHALEEAEVERRLRARRPGLEPVQRRLVAEVPVAGRHRALLDLVVDAADDAPRRRLPLGQPHQRLDLAREPRRRRQAPAAGGRGSRRPSAACCRAAPPPRRRGCGRWRRRRTRRHGRRRRTGAASTARTPSTAPDGSPAAAVGTS